MSEIKSIRAREILDSRGKATVEATLTTELGKFSASVPSGVSTGKYEGVELKDEDGRGVSRAIDNVERIIAPALEKEDLADQKRIDEILIQLDGTKNKFRLGVNAILPVSLAACRAIAASRGLFLYCYLAELAENKSPLTLPKPSFNMIEGGKHAANNLAFQEFMVIPPKESFRENLEIGKTVYKKLGDILKDKVKQVNLSAEGAFSPTINLTILDTFKNIYEKTLTLIVNSSQGEDVSVAIDAAASSFYQNGKYKFEGKTILKEELMGVYQNLISRYPVISIEDPFSEEDFEGFAELKNKIGDVITIFGDDLTVSNIERIKLAKEKNACSGLILKPNQIGTVTETIEAARLAKSYGWKIMVSNRAGETEDDFIADLAVGIGAEFIKSGAPLPKERMAKYNRLVKIEEELHSATKF